MTVQRTRRSLSASTPSRAFSRRRRMEFGLSMQAAAMAASTRRLTWPNSPGAWGFESWHYYDHDEAEAASRLAAMQEAADAVVRLPKGDAIESALLRDVPDDEIIAALLDLNQNYALPLPTNWQSLIGTDLMVPAIKALKSNNGLHAPFVRALTGTLPPVAIQALSAAIECAREVRVDTYVQL
jgi:hypothetical protein